jgi:hypothetical protein
VTTLFPLPHTHTHTHTHTHGPVSRLFRTLYFHQLPPSLKLNSVVAVPYPFNVFEDFTFQLLFVISFYSFIVSILSVEATVLDIWETVCAPCPHEFTISINYYEYAIKNLMWARRGVNTCKSGYMGNRNGRIMV